MKNALFSWDFVLQLFCATKMVEVTADSNCLIDTLYFAYVFPCKTLLGPATQAILSIHTLSVKKTLYFLSSKKTAHHNRGSIAV